MSNLTGQPVRQKGQKPIHGTTAAKAHMARVAACRCAVCGRPGPSTVHHPICGRFSSARASDFDTVAMCWPCHLGPEGIHANKAAWVAKNGPDTDFIAVTLNMIEGANAP